MVEEIHYYTDLTKKMEDWGSKDLIVLYLYDFPFFVNYPSYKELVVTSLRTEKVCFLRGNINNCDDLASINKCNVYPAFAFIKDGKILNCSTHTRNPQLLKYYVEKYGTPRQSFETRYTKEHSLDDSLKRWKILMKRPSTSARSELQDEPLLSTTSYCEQKEGPQFQYSDFVRKLLQQKTRQG